MYATHSPHSPKPSGMFGNLATGWLLDATGSYTAVFWFLAVLYTAAAGMWAVCTSSDPVSHA